jgi:hypothetical protein
LAACGEISPYGQTLLGIADGFDSVFPNPDETQDSSNSVAFQLSGGVDYRVSDHLPSVSLMLDGYVLNRQIQRITFRTPLGLVPVLLCALAPIADKYDIAVLGDGEYRIGNDKHRMGRSQQEREERASGDNSPTGTCGRRTGGPPMGPDME